MTSNNDNKMVTWNYEVVHCVPDTVSIAEDGSCLVDYLETSEPRQICLPTHVVDPQVFLDELARRDATDVVAFVNFQKVEVN